MKTERQIIHETLQILEEKGLLKEVSKGFAYYITNDDYDKVYTSYVFNAKEIKEFIISYLSANKEETLYYYKVNNDKKYTGDVLIDVFENNPNNGNPSKVITKGNKDYYVSLAK